MKRKLSVLAAALLALGLAALFLLSWPETDRQASPEEAVSAGAEAPPTPAPEPTAEELAQEILAGMTLEEKVWQMMYVFPQDVTGSYTCTDLEQWADALALRGAGGFVISTENMESAETLKAMLACLPHAADITPFIGVDEEGGKVERLAYTLGATTSLKPMYTYKDEGAGTAYANAKTLAGDIAAFGFNQDFAPVADVWTNEENTVIGQRAYSDDPEQAAELVAAAVRGFTDGGVIATLKHFPGHGDTAEDSHYGSAVSQKALEELRTCEFLPFLSGIEAGAGMVMVGHISLPQVDGDTPATLSKVLVTDVLRGELGFEGVVISDSFTMAAISGRYSQREAAVLAIQAGCDMILGSDDPDGVVQAIMEEIPEQRIDESVFRILLLKLESGILGQDAPAPESGTAPENSTAQEEGSP